MDQRELRRTFRRIRRELSPHARTRAAQSLRRAFLHQRFLRARRIGFYLATAEEIDTWPLIAKACALGKSCYLPLVTDRLMRWVDPPLRYQQFNPLQPELAQNRFGILEPRWNPRAQIDIRRLDILLVPLVAFDRSGNRVGMGQGFYDRTLAPLVGSPQKPWLVGCAFSAQETSAIRQNEWDVKLDAILTEKGLMMA